MPMQGFMLDSARTLESRAYYRAFIDFTAQRGCDTLLWHFCDDQGCSLRFDALPEAASPNAYTRPELHDLLDHASDRGVTVIPEVETLGHTRFITRHRPDLDALRENDDEFTSLCPVHPRTREIVAALLDEVCDVFDSEHVHVGLDEVNFGQHPLTREALRTRTPGDVFAEHIRFLHDRLAARGRRLMMWGDHLLKDPSIVAALPESIRRGMLVANWQYAPTIPPHSTATLQRAGFDVVNCPALISHDQPLFPGEAFAMPNLRHTMTHAREHNSAGVLTTVWTPQRYLHGALWPAMHVAAELMREGADLDLRASLRRHAADTHGLDADDAWLNAMATLFEHSPMRKPWVAALKLELDERLTGLDLQAKAARWQAVSADLAAARHAVQRHTAAYDTLLLMVELLAHVWERAADAEAGRLEPASLDVDAAMGRRLAAAWDAERFADDPRKRQPVFPFDADNHLLVAFERGSARARAHVENGLTLTTPAHAPA